MRKELFEGHKILVDLGQLPNELPQIKKGEREKLTTAQTEFNRLNKKIASIREEMLLMPEKLELVERYYKRIILPRRKARNELMEQALFKLDEMYEERMVAENDLFDLSGAIYSLMDQLDLESDEWSAADVKRITALSEKHERIQLKISEEAFERLLMDDMLDFYTDATGESPTPKMEMAKSRDELEKLVNYALEQYAKKKAREPQAEEESDDFQDFSEYFAEYEKNFNSEKKRKKVTKTDLKRQQIEELTQTSIHALYKELEKTLHPASEPDKKKRAHKEGQLKKLTEAYKKNDLAMLLIMQLMLMDEASESAPYTQSDDLLKGYNKVLREQLKSLEAEQEQLAYGYLQLPESLCELLLLPYKKLVMQVDYLAQDTDDLFQKIKRDIQQMTTKQGVGKLIRQRREDRVKEEANAYLKQGQSPFRNELERNMWNNFR